MQIQLLQYNYGECPYLKDRSWIVHGFFSRNLQSSAFDVLLNHGYRRSGSFFYQNSCPDCEDCISLRVDVNRFQPSRSQKRALKKNSDIEIFRKRPVFTDEVYSLYCDYRLGRHEDKEVLNEEGFKELFIQSTVDSWMMEYRLRGKLVGCGWVDLSENGLSSVYFIFGTEFNNRSLGTFSVLKEIEWCKALELQWLYLGFWVQKNRKMSYKANFKPNEKLIQGSWKDYTDLDGIEYDCHSKDPEA